MVLELLVSVAPGIGQMVETVDPLLFAIVVVGVLVLVVEVVAEKVLVVALGLVPVLDQILVATAKIFHLMVSISANVGVEYVKL